MKSQVTVNGQSGGWSEGEAGHRLRRAKPSTAGTWEWVSNRWTAQ
jgi:hypothetical protein